MRHRWTGVRNSGTISNSARNLNIMALGNALCSLVGQSCSGERPLFTGCNYFADRKKLIFCKYTHGSVFYVYKLNSTHTDCIFHKNSFRTTALDVILHLKIEAISIVTPHFPLTFVNCVLIHLKQTLSSIKAV